MPINKESLNRKLYKALGRFDPKPVDYKNEVTPLEDEADAFKFNFTKDGESYGLVYATLDDTNALTIWYDDDVLDSPDAVTPGLDYDDTFSGFLKFIKRWAMNNQLSFKLDNKDHLGNEMARRKRMKDKEKISEGYYALGKKASYSDAVPNVKIVLQHSKVMQEGEQRFRHIEKIFVENQNGERFLVPTTKPGLARVFARHIAEGGTPYDERSGHIQSLVEEYNKMAGFVRATRNGQFNESAQQLVQEGINHYLHLRESLGKLTGHKGYTAYFESWTPPLMEDDTDASSINELFVQETLDPRIESVMPILSRLHKHVAEMKEVSELDEWADSLLSEKMVMGADSDASSAGTMYEEEGIQSNNPVGIPESELDEEGKGLWANIHAKRERIKHGSGEKMRKPGSKGAPTAQNFKDAAKTSNEGIGDVAKKVGGAIKKAGSKALSTLGHGSDEELLKDLQKNAGVSNPENIKPKQVKEDDLEEGIFDGVDHASVASNLAKLAKVIKSVQTPEQFAVAQKYAQRMRGAIMNHQHDKMSFGSGLRANLGVMRDVDADLKAKAAELGINFQPLEEDEFAGDYKTGPAGQWRNKGPKANKPAKVGDLVGASESKETDEPAIKEGQDDLDAILRIIKK